MNIQQSQKHIGDILKALEGLSYEEATLVLKAVQERLAGLCKLQF